MDLLKRIFSEVSWRRANVWLGTTEFRVLYHPYRPRSGALPDVQPIHVPFPLSVEEIRVRYPAPRANLSTHFLVHLIGARQQEQLFAQDLVNDPIVYMGLPGAEMIFLHLELSPTVDLQPSRSQSAH